ncbi:MAG TPA: DUF2231 domain-containing protein [Terriglobales bacterium]|nr:DUF2231 domain-containing protein [Terriglobales bacterium]
MIQMPPIPSWDGLHPLIIHFPIALLLVAPILVLVGAPLKPEKGRPVLYVALALMIAGTLSIFVAAATGEEAGKLAERTPQIDAVLERHEELADATRAVFSGLTVIFAAIIFAPMAFHKLSGRLVATVLPLVFLLFYGVGVLLLTNTAHNGGRLVHEFGVRAMVAPTSVPVADSAAEAGAQKADRD